MKKKLLLITLMVALFVCVFVISANAAATNVFGTVETNGAIDLTGMATDTDVYVVLYDGTEYHTYPSQYIVTNADSIAFNFDKINAAFTKSYDITSIIRLQVPSHVKTFSGVFAYGKNKNIVELSFPNDSALTTFSYGTFEQCSALEKINIPATTTSLGGHMFNVCKALTTVTFDSGFAMTSLPSSMFKGCSSLKKVVIPNSVQSLSGHTFDGCSSLEEVVFGANLKKTGTDEFAYAASGTKAIKIYVSASFYAEEETVPSRIYSWDTNHMKNVTYYFVGTKQEAEAIIAKAEFANIKNAKVVPWDKSKGEDHTDYVVSGSNVFVYGYNKCDAFYDSIHAVGTPKYTFDSYVTDAHMIGTCSQCREQSVSETYAPIVSFLGHSMKIDGTAVTVGYSIDNASLQKYIEAGNTFNYGVVGYIPTAEEGNSYAPLTKGENGVEAIDKQYTIHAGIEEEYASVDFVIKGFPQEAVSLIMCMYVYDGTDIVYLCGTCESDFEQVDTAYAVTIDVTSNTITKATENEEVTE